MKKKNILKFPTPNDSFPFFKEILENGYHVFSMENAKVPDYYPNKFPDYPGVDLQHLHVGDVVTIRVFFRIGAGKNVRADGGYLDLEVEHIDGETGRFQHRRFSGWDNDNREVRVYGFQSIL